MIPMAIKQVNDDWDIEDMSHLLYLEASLIETGYKGEELT